MVCRLCAVSGPAFSHPTNKLIKIVGWSAHARWIETSAAQFDRISSDDSKTEGAGKPHSFDLSNRSEISLVAR
jgi:hypothetical protein